MPSIHNVPLHWRRAPCLCMELNTRVLRCASVPTAPQWAELHITQLCKFMFLWKLMPLAYSKVAHCKNQYVFWWYSVSDDDLFLLNFNLWRNFNVHTVHIRRIRRKKQQYALIVPSFIYFYVLAPTCFGSGLPSSGSLLDPPELLENTNWGLVYQITCGYVACVPDCRGSVCCVSQLGTCTISAYCCFFF
jgi:hypothetical protein